MEEENQIHKLFRLYLGKTFSVKSRILFGRWLRSSQDKQEKEECLQTYWEQTPAEASTETRQDWNRMIRRLQEPAKTRKTLWLPAMRYAAAAVLLVLLSIGSTYWLMQPETVAQAPEMVEYFHPGGKAREIILPDQSRIWLKGRTLLVYPKNFEQGKQRTVYLSGEASFKVARDEQKPFLVKTANLDVQVLGTTFNVEAYPEDSLTTTTLEEGSVQVTLKDEQHSSAILKPNEQLVYSNQRKSAQIQTVDVSSFELERQGFLVFNNATFRQIVASLEREYQVTIRCAFTPNETEQYKLRFSPDESLEEALRILCQLARVNYQIKGDVVILS